MCCLVLIGYRPQEHAKFSLGKNLNQYLPVRAWLVTALDIQAQSKLEWLNCESHRPPLEYEGSIESKSSFKKLRKSLPLESDTWKVIFHWERIKSHSDFL